MKCLKKLIMLYLLKKKFIEKARELFKELYDYFFYMNIVGK